jgi:type II secretory pathway component PulJ
MMRRGGFTLIEALIGIIIGSLIVIGAFQLLGNASVISERHRAFSALQITAQEAILMLQADIEAAEAIMRGGRRYEIARNEDRVRVILIRNGAAPPGKPGLVAVTWSIGEDGIQRWAGPKVDGEGAGYRLINTASSFHLNEKRSDVLGFPVWELRIGEVQFDVWFPTA